MIFMKKFFKILILLTFIFNTLIEDFLQKEKKLEAWKEAIIYAQSLAQEQEKINRSSAKYKHLEETYQQASKEIESLNKSLLDWEANRLSVESLHEAEKLLQSVGYSVNNQLAQDLKEIEELNQELAKTEKRHQRLSLDIDQAQESLKGLEEQLSRTLASRREIADKVFDPVFIMELYFFASPIISQRQADILE